MFFFAQPVAAQRQTSTLPLRFAQLVIILQLALIAWAFIRRKQKPA